jgi:phosphatidylethanolamine-binding protein (PEBP) family uncharacterized protein
MNAIKLASFATTGFSLALVFAGCGASNNGASGSGGTSSSGGTTGTGGATGSGGMAGTGGAIGSGGMAGTGGATGTGGMAGVGGATGTGGASGSGGTVGVGGAAGTGGASGTGGAIGTTASGGATGAAGRGTGGAMGMGGATGSGGTTGSAGSSGGTMTLTSPDQVEGAKFGTAYTCAASNGTFGAGVNPELDWANVPSGTMSFAITFIDTKLGATSAMGQHWAIWDIPATVRQFPKATTTLTGELAGAMQTNKYLAPCPSGNDTYEFTLYALAAATLNVTGASGSGTSNSAGVAKVLSALQAVTPLATATLHGTSGPKGL